MLMEGKDRGRERGKPGGEEIDNGPQIKPPKVTITSDGSYFKNRIIGILPTTIVT